MGTKLHQNCKICSRAIFMKNRGNHLSIVETGVEVASLVYLLWLHGTSKKTENMECLQGSTLNPHSDVSFGMRKKRAHREVHLYHELQQGCIGLPSQAGASICTPTLVPDVCKQWYTTYLNLYIPLSV